MCVSWVKLLWEGVSQRQNGKKGDGVLFWLTIFLESSWDRRLNNMEKANPGLKDRARLWYPAIPDHVHSATQYHQQGPARTHGAKREDPDAMIHIIIHWRTATRSLFPTIRPPHNYALWGPPQGSSAIHPSSTPSKLTPIVPEWRHGCLSQDLTNFPASENLFPDGRDAVPKNGA